MPGRADVAIVEYLAANGYHPRSSKHGDALCGFLLKDLLDTCPVFHGAAERNEIVFQRNYTIEPDSPDRWNADLVVGSPSRPHAPDAERIGLLARGDPREIWIAVDVKTIMTEHGKARRNRQRDLNSFQDILHRKNSRTIVGGLMIVNVAPRFQTPLARRSGGLNEHRNVERLVAEIVTMMNGLARAQPEPGRPGIEALGVIVVAHTNLPGDTTRLVTEPPAPVPGHALSYATSSGSCVRHSRRVLARRLDRGDQQPMVSITGRRKRSPTVDRRALASRA